MAARDQGRVAHRPGGLVASQQQQEEEAGRGQEQSAESGRPRQSRDTQLTRSRALPRHVVILADELVVVQHVQLLARGQLLAAHHAGEAVEVVHLVARPPHQVVGGDALAAAPALGAVPPATATTTTTTTSETNLKDSFTNHLCMTYDMDKASTELISAGYRKFLEGDEEY